MTVNLDQFRTPKSVEHCKFARFVAELTGDDLDSVQAAVKAHDITTRSIYRWAVARGFKGSESIVQGHRRGGCLCAR
jgi:hypothetical protein